MASLNRGRARLVAASLASPAFVGRRRPLDRRLVHALHQENAMLSIKHCVAVLALLAASVQYADAAPRPAPAADVTGDWTLDYPAEGTSWSFEQTANSYVANQTEPTCEEVDLGFIVVNVCSQEQMIGQRIGNFLVGISQVEVVEDLTQTSVVLPYGVHILRVTDVTLDGTVISANGQTPVSGERVP
jgi:hypothetical protein